MTPEKVYLYQSIGLSTIVPLVVGETPIETYVRQDVVDKMVQDTCEAVSDAIKAEMIKK